MEDVPYVLSATAAEALSWLHSIERGEIAGQRDIPWLHLNENWCCGPSHILIQQHWCLWGLLPQPAEGAPMDISGPFSFPGLISIGLLVRVTTVVLGCCLLCKAGGEYMLQTYEHRKLWIKYSLHQSISICFNTNIFELELTHTRPIKFHWTLLSWMTVFDRSGPRKTLFSFFFYQNISSQEPHWQDSQTVYFTLSEPKARI